MIGLVKTLQRTCLRLFALLAPALILSGCNSDVITPGSPDVTQEEYVQLARLGASGDTEAIKRLLSAESVINDRILHIKWADRLARLGSAEGYEMASMSRGMAASELEIGDPERLLLLTEALEFQLKAAEIDPETYLPANGVVRALQAKIATEKKELDQRYGPLRPWKVHAKAEGEGTPTVTPSIS